MKKALIVAIGYKDPLNGYEFWGSFNDGFNIANLLFHKYGYEYDNIRILSDLDGYAMPTKRNVIQGIKWLVKDASAGDSVVFCYFGHGGQQQDNNNDEGDQNDELLCTLGRALVDDELYSQLFARLPKGVRATCIVDACHSGTIADQPFIGTFPPLPWKKPQRIEITQNSTGSLCEADVVSFSGAKDDQSSYEWDLQFDPIVLFPSGPRYPYVTDPNRKNNRTGIVSAHLVQSLMSEPPIEQPVQILRKMHIACKGSNTPCISASREGLFSEVFYM